MKKGLKALLVATVLSCATAAFAAAPTIGTIPDVRIGDQEPPEALQHTDANFFVFTDAFSFDEKVTDADTPKADLRWSFDEGDNPVTGNVADGRWFQVNGFDSVHLGSADMATCQSGGFTDHVLPTNDLRDVSAFATFRDVILSPLVPGTLPFDDANVQANAAAHGQGKVVRFVVSDGQNVDHTDILVKSVDDSTDEVSGAALIVYDDDTFDTQETGAWTTFGATVTVTTANVCDYTSGAYRVRALTIGPAKYHSAGWSQNRTVGADYKWVPYNSIGSDNYVRGKFYIYAQPGTEGWTTLNDIPGFAVRLAHRFVYTTQQVIDCNDPSTAGAIELRPSTDSTKPSIYRLDFDPIDTPYLNTYTNADGTKDGVAAGFETWELSTTPRGYICLTELVTGTYAKSALGTAKWTENLTTITGGTSVVGNYTKGATLDNGATWIAPDSAGMITLTAAGSAVVLNGSAVPTDKIGSYYYEIPSLATNLRTRVAENELYRVRFHLTSTQNVAAQSPMWLSARSIYYSYVTYVWMNGGTYGAAGSTNNRQIIPGVGCLNPDIETGDTTGGWYTLIQNSPMSMDIAADRSGATIADRMPVISAMPPRGDAATSRRDVRPTIQMWDSMTGEPEAGYVRVDRVLIETFDQIAD